MERREIIRTIDDHLTSLESWLGGENGIGGNANNAAAFLYTAGRKLETVRNVTDSEDIASLRQRYESLKRNAVERFNLVLVRVGLSEGNTREYLEMPALQSSGGYAGR